MTKSNLIEMRRQLVSIATELEQAGKAFDAAKDRHKHLVRVYSDLSAKYSEARWQLLNQELTEAAPGDTCVSDQSFYKDYR